MNNETLKAQARTGRRRRFSLASLRSSALALVVANLTPLYGLYFLNWSAASIISLYWMESVVIGVFTVLKMRISEYPSYARHPNQKKPVRVLSGFGQSAIRKDDIKGFIRVYGFMHLGYGYYILKMFGDRIYDELPPLVISLLFLIFSHNNSYNRDFIQGGEFKRVKYKSLKWQAYPRLIIIHLAGRYGGAWAEARGSLHRFLLALVILKTLFELGLHMAKRRKARLEGGVELAIPIGKRESRNHRGNS